MSTARRPGAGCRRDWAMGRSIIRSILQVSTTTLPFYLWYKSSTHFVQPPPRRPSRGLQVNRGIRCAIQTGGAAAAPTNVNAAQPTVGIDSPDLLEGGDYDRPLVAVIVLEPLYDPLPSSGHAAIIVEEVV